MTQTKKTGTRKRATVNANTSSHHKEVRVQWDDLDTEIDEQIAPLILELWKAGLMTLMSCQDNPEGWVWVQFPLVLFAEAFMDLMEKESGIPLFDLRRRWKYDIYPVTLPEALFDDYPEALMPNGPSLRFTVSVRFPKADLPTVLETVRRHNAQCSQLEDTGERKDGDE
jgi:hypothetical protein